MSTGIDKRCEILSELWMSYKDQAELSDFIAYNDLGLSLSFSINEDIVKTTPLAESYINESFDLLLEAMGLEDRGFNSLNEIFSVG